MIRFFDSTTKVLVAIGGLIAAITGLVTLVVQLLPTGQSTVPQLLPTAQSTVASGSPVKIDAVSVVRTVLQGAPTCSRRKGSSLPRSFEV